MVFRGKQDAGSDLFANSLKTFDQPTRSPWNARAQSRFTVHRLYFSIQPLPAAPVLLLLLVVVLLPLLLLFVVVTVVMLLLLVPITITFIVLVAAALPLLR